ncbi:MULTISPECIES: hypothetical protein [Burkholderia]|nr:MULTISPECIES: hypothetical protein [Burkholderia]MBR8428283.1 hypothetical protein [Burkholderia cenocepacia]MDN7669317.1 hypothetical protein [Burkholderia vietnamiensis]
MPLPESLSAARDSAVERHGETVHDGQVSRSHSGSLRQCQDEAGFGLEDEIVDGSVRPEGGLVLSGRDPALAEDRPANGARRKSSAFVGSRIRYQTFELEVTAIGPFSGTAGEPAVQFQARVIGPDIVRTGTMINTRWGICEVVE